MHPQRPTKNESIAEINVLHYRRFTLFGAELVMRNFPEAMKQLDKNSDDLLRYRMQSPFTPAINYPDMYADGNERTLSPEKRFMQAIAEENDLNPAVIAINFPRQIGPFLRQVYGVIGAKYDSSGNEIRRDMRFYFPEIGRLAEIVTNTRAGFNAHTPIQFLSSARQGIVRLKNNELSTGTAMKEDYLKELSTRRA